MKQAKNLRYKRTLFVGLGGAGAKTLRIVKEQIKDANGGSLPGQVKFLLIDTNATDLANYRDFDCSEKVCIAVREPYQRYMHDNDPNIKTHKYIPKQNVHSLLALERGAGQIRSNGHFAVIENQYSNKLVQVFRYASEELEDIDIKGETLERDPKIEVRLVFSLAGGTGSGTFLPISLLLRSAIKHCELTAYMYSATHYERIVEKSAKYSVMQNAYASLCELDHMMHFGLNNRNQEPIQFNFGPEENQWITQCARPFEEVYYIDKITSLPTPDTIEFAYNEIERMQKNTADALFLAATNIISPHTGTVDNVRQKVMEGQFDVNDKFAWVSGQGLAELYLCPQGITASKVVAAGNIALLARTGDCEIDTTTQNSIVSSFMENKWDESNGDDDGDPILSNFLTKEDIEHACRDMLRKIRQDSKRYDSFGIDLNGILKSKAKPLSDSIKSTLVDSFSKDIDELIKKLLNEDKYGTNQIQGAQGKDYGISLVTLIAVLNGIKDKLQVSKDTLKKEKVDLSTKEDEASADVDAFIEANKPHNVAQPKQGFIDRLFGNQQHQNINTQQSIDPTDYAEKLAKEKSKPLTYMVLGERHEVAIEVLSDCIKYTVGVIEKIELWCTLLKAAYDFGIKQEIKVDDTHASTEKKENRVEVQLLDVDKFRLSYDNIVDIAENRNKNSTDEGQSIFEALCKLISAKTGNLQHYLSEGVVQKKNTDEDKKSQFNKEQRTPFQKSIDRLIDLSTPTMQLDGHGFGDRVKADQFWYVMTDCGEDDTAESREQRKELKSDSVGGLLKRAIEQNTLGERVNLVHVSGWKNKALLYRVIAAVPPYFVEGVCRSDRGGITLEGCYEELKKTKRTYTPFSHEELRKKLENRICVLKPHEGMAESDTMEHWLNFNLLEYIHFESKKGTAGQYSILSKRLGEVLTDNLTDQNSILILGQTRQEAFETFSRYCKALVEEYSEDKEKQEERSYTELTNPLDYENQDEYRKTFIMEGKEYLEKIFEKYTFLWHGKPIEWIDLNKYLTKEDADYDILRKEMDAMDVRQKRYQKEQNERNKAENTSKGYDKE